MTVLRSRSSRDDSQAIVRWPVLPRPAASAASPGTDASAATIRGNRIPQQQIGRTSKQGQVPAEAAGVVQSPDDRVDHVEPIYEDQVAMLGGLQRTATASSTFRCPVSQRSGRHSDTTSRHFVLNGRLPAKDEGAPARSLSDVTAVGRRPTRRTMGVRCGVLQRIEVG